MGSKTILNYELAERIGGGGMGVVWRAVDKKLGREVALKFLSEAGVHDTQMQQRFVREARSASVLNHPNIVTIHEINSDGGRLFIAMELVRGEPLSHVLKHRRLDVEKATEYAAQVCEGLGAAHSAKIVHRDIKPANVMITADGRAKILDFGLAKLRELKSAPAADDPPTVTAETSKGVIMGTVPYMSPEQATGSDVDARSDVFSFGVTLYEMLGGRRPFAGDSNMTLIRAILASEPTPLAALAPGVPRALVDVVERCMRKEPSARYLDGAAVARHLRIVQRTAFSARPSDVSTVAMVRPSMSRWKRYVVTGALAAGLVAVTAVLTWPEKRAVVVEQPATAELQEAQGLLLRYDKKGNIDRAIELLEKVRGNRASRAPVLAALAEAYVRKYSASGDRALLQKAVESGEGAVAENGDLATAHVGLGMALAAKGKVADAERRFARALELNPLSGRAHLGMAKLKAGKEAERLFAKAVELSTGDWIALHEWAIYSTNRSRYDEAINAWKRAFALTRDNVSVMGYLGAGYHLKGQYGEAAAMYQQALELDGNVASVWTNLSTTRFFQGNYPDAVRSAEKARELAPANALYWGNLADIYRWAGMPSKAAPAYSMAIKLTKERLENLWLRGLLGRFAVNSR